MAVQSKVSFGSPTINVGSIGGGGSFTERLDRKERNKKLDEMARRRDTENLRRFEIAQSRLNQQDQLAAEALTYQKGRNVISDGYAANRDSQATARATESSEKHDWASDKQDSWAIKDKLLAKDDKRIDIMKEQDFQIGQSLGDIQDSVTTETADALNNMFEQALASPNPKKDIAELSRAASNAYDMGKLDLNKVTDAEGYTTKLTSKLLKNKAQPTTIDKIVKTLTAGAVESDKAREESLKAGHKAIQETYKTDLSANEKLKETGSFDSVKLAKSDLMKNLDNAKTDYWEGFTKNKQNEPTGILNKSEEIGQEELIPAMTELMAMEFVTKRDKNKKTLSRTKLTEAQAMEAMQNAYNDRAVFSDVVDANELLEAAKFIAIRDKDKVTKATSADMAKQNQQQRALLDAKFAKGDAEQQLRNLFKMP